MRKHLTTDYIFRTATTDERMTKKQRALFHAFNPNGLLAKMPTFDDVTYGTKYHPGLLSLYGRDDNYHAKQLMKIATGKQKRFTSWDVAYHIKQLTTDIEEGWIKVKAWQESKREEEVNLAQTKRLYELKLL